MAKAKRPDDSAKPPRKPRVKNESKVIAAPGAWDGTLGTEVCYQTEPNSQVPAMEAEQVLGAKIPMTKRCVGQGQPMPIDEEPTLGASEFVPKPSVIGLGWFAGMDLSKEEIAAKLRNYTDHGTFEPAADTPNASNALMEGDTDETTLEPRTVEGSREQTREADGAATQTNTQTEHGTDTEGKGDDPLQPAAADLLDSANLGGILVALAREGEGRAACWERLRKEARAAGMPRNQGPGTAYEWATREVERLFPPKVKLPEPPPEPEPAAVEEPAIPPPLESEMSTIVDIEPAAPAPTPSTDDVPGLGTLPPDWPTLPANASLQVEISWVSANRLRVRDGTGVDLSKALSPAPSYSALSWLETSILFPSKFADISVKATQNQEDEQASTRRERMAIDEIRSLLAEMMEG